MKVLVKAPFLNSYGLFKKGDQLEIKAEDLDTTLMEPVPDDDPEETTEEQPKKSPEKKAGRRKKAE